MQRFNKVVALLLCVVMLIGFVPVSALAADGAGTVVDAAIIFSDLHTNKSDYKESTLKGILNAIKAADLPVSSVTSAGDAFSVNEDSSKSNGPYTGYTGTITGYIRDVLGQIPVNYVWSDHDRYAVEADGSTPLDKTSRLVYGAGADGVYGTDDDGNYYIYSLSMGDLCSYDRYSAGFNYTQSSNNRASKGFTSTVAGAIENFKADAAKLNKDRPLFITSHQPLFDNRNDNAFAEDWFDAINEVAEGMDVAFFYGHNHKYDTGSDYYYAKGSKMNVATADNWNWNYEVGQGWKPSVDLTSEQKTLNFTHMCAGYMAPSSTGSTSSTTREGVAVAITIYDDAINYTTYNSSGVYTGNYALNETVTRSFASASVPEETVPETIEPSVPETSEPENEDPEIGEEMSNSVTIGGQSYEEKTVYVRVDSFEDGEKYLLIGEDGPNNGNPIALVNNNGSDITAAVTVNTGSITVDGVTYSDGYIELDNSNAVFTASGSASNGYTLKNGSHYIGGTNATTLYSSSNSAVRVTYDDSAARLKTASGTTRYLYYSTYNGETWKWATTSSSNTSSRAMYIYREVTAKIPTGPASVTYTMQASDLKHNLVGDNKTALLDYALLADGKEATALPTGGKYTFGISGDNHDIIESIAADGTITFTGEHGSCRVKVAYTWTDGDQTYTVYKYVTVSVVTPSNYPEYPDEGAVKVGKTGTGIDFQSSGIAQVEISASGIPIKKGADIIVMVDTSSSMQRHVDCGEKSCTDSSCSKVTRQAELVKALNALVDVFQTKDESGGYRDLKVAFADFNGFFGDQGNTKFEGQTVSGTTPYDLDSEDYTDAHFNADGSVHVIQGSSLDYSAFMTPAQMTGIDFGEFETKSGTNYDYAFDVIYQLGHAAKKHNEQIGENRDLFVIFMSDGAPNQFNYFGAVGGDTGSSKLWDNWLLGSWTADDLNSSNLNSTANKHYYDLNDHDNDGFINEHRMASAIKGSPDDMFEVIRKSTAGLTDILTETHTNNLYEVPGLGATMYSIAFAPANDGDIDKESMLHALQQIASDQEGTTKYYYEVEASAGLADIFKGIGSEIAYAAYNARFVDQVGDDYDLQMKTSTYSVVDGTSTTSKTLAPKIEIISYDIYTAGETIPAGKHIGDRKGTYKVLETVTFNANGTEAYSDQINGGKTNILADGTQAGYVKGVIYAKTFLYSTNVTSVAVEGVSIPTGTKSDGTTTGSTNMLPSETFYWKMGTVQTSELAMRYYVYLEGSMEGTREGGSYPTNEYATLYYDNYLHNPCKKDTVSPVLAWKEANVSYAFYLVDENGNIIVNQTTGQTGSFANKIAVTNPVLHKTMELNNDEEVDAIDIVAEGVLPEGYTLYDYDGTDGAKYTVTINSNTTGSWEIEGVKDVQTTYVTQFAPNDASAYSNEKNVAKVGLDYTHTVVWFAVVWKIQALPDTVVIDYGLPVDISVLRNDMFGDNGKLTGIGPYSDSLNLDGHDTTPASGFGTSYTGTYGTAKADAATGKVRYTPANMQMNGYEKFAYAVNYTGATNPGYYYDTVTVIPATTIYYEDSFVEFDNLTWQQKVGGEAWEGEWAVVENPASSIWTQAGTTVSGATQDEDRPGRYSLTDANNIYGYDSTNLGMSQYSLGSAMKATVDYDNAAQASFTFWGTGFDVISMTDSTTGTIFVKVYDESGAKVKDLTVDTYYGYTYDLYNVTYTYTDGQWLKTVGSAVTDENTVAKDPVFPETPNEGAVVTAVEGQWVLTPDAGKGIWQVPVMEVEGLTYGKYKAVIQAIYEPAFDHDTSDTPATYDFYLDAIRIYDPANDGAVDGDTVIEDAYKADGEGWPSYIELRNKLIDTNTLGNASTATKVEGLVFIDGNASVGDTAIKDYISYGPNNEVYLAPGQRVAFLLSTPDNIANVHIGIKSADGKSATCTITNIAKATNSETGVKAGDYYNPKTDAVDTATDMYYDLTGWKNDIIVISNTGNKYNTDGIISLTNIKSTYTSDPNATETTEAQTYGLRNASLELAAVGDQSYGLMTASEDVPETTVPETIVEEKTVPELFETYIYMTPETASLVVDTLNAEEEPEVPETTVPEETEPEETVPENTVPEETEPEPTVPEETEPEDFEPAYVNVKLNKTNVKVGQKVLVTVTTSADVDYVIINDTVVTTYRTGSTGNRIWKRNVTGTVVGTMNIEVVCCNADDVAAEPVVQTVTVQRKTIWDYIWDLLG